MLSTKPPKCKQCKQRTTHLRELIHPQCVDAFLAGLRKKQAANSRKEAKADRAKTRARKEAVKSFTELEGECRAIVQKIARIRDRADGCISCHMGPNYDGVWHGSHFRPAGNHGAVQFHLWNIHKSCAQCNRFKGGNIEGYRPRLVEKIGQARVDWLEAQNHLVKKTPQYRAYLVRFKAVMGRRCKRLAKAAG